MNILESIAALNSLLKRAIAALREPKRLELGLREMQAKGAIEWAHQVRRLTEPVARHESDLVLLLSQAK